MKRLQFRRSARQEFVAAAARYEEVAQFGAKFRATVEVALKDILELPETWPAWPGDDRYRWRQCGTPFRSYSVIYEIVDDVVVVVAIAHAKKRPGYWRKT